MAPQLLLMVMFKYDTLGQNSQQVHALGQCSMSTNIVVTI